MSESPKQDNEEKLHPLERVISDSQELEGAKNVIPLRTDKQSSVVIINEKPWHRSLAYKLLEGVTDGDCAKQFDKSVQQVRNVKLQPWFKELVGELSEQHFENNIAGLLEGAAVDSILTLQNLATNGKSEAIKRMAASDLLDKHLKIREVKTPEPEEDTEEALDRINKELDKLKKRNE